MVKKRTKKPAAFRDALGASSKLREVRVHERDGVASFTHVPVSAIRDFGKALAGVDVQATAKTSKKKPAKKASVKKTAPRKKPRVRTT